MRPALLAAHAGEVGVPLPVLNLLEYDPPGRVRIFVEKPVPSRQVGPQPVEGLPAQSGAFLPVETVGVLALAAPGQAAAQAAL